MAIKKVKQDDPSKIENNTGTELDILKKIEIAYYKNNPTVQKRNTERSIDWFSGYIPKSWNRAKTSQLFRDQKLWSEKITPGAMLFFEYDAKNKDTLPVWDRYPLIFPWDVWKGKDGATLFIGINLHYLPPAMRLAAMKALLTLRNEKRYRARTKLKISWEVLKALSVNRMFEHSVKMYRLDHVKSTFVNIPAQSWEMAVFLPLARWQNGTKSTAWDMAKITRSKKK